MRLLAALVMAGLLSGAATQVHAKTVVYYVVPTGTQVRERPGDHHPVVYTTKEIDTVKRVGMNKLYGRWLRGSVDGAPKCSADWCEVNTGHGKFGFVPKAVVQRKSYVDNGEMDDLFDDLW
jgi:hypothetical protein